MGAAVGFDHGGSFHSAHFFELADQPLAVTVSVDESVWQKFMAALEQEGVDLSYLMVPVEFGRVGKRYP